MHMELTNEKACLCALNRIFGFEPKIATTLISNIGSASEIFSMGTESIDKILGPYSKFKGTVSLQAMEKAARELEELSKNNIRFVGWSETDYPALLKECDDPPVGLYIKSTTPTKDLFDQRKMIAIIGTRDLSIYGKECCEDIVSALASTPKPPVIVSGLALGVDICAHRKAIEKGIPTIGVMATGPETIYPSRHHDFASRLWRTPGCALVTDYPPDTAPLAIHFLRRNRIIAGLSHSTILVESKIKGGGMMTSRLAFSYGRDVYAVPGRMDDSRSQGCNLLIKERIAEAIQSPEGLIDSLGLGKIRSSSGTDFGNITKRLYKDRLSGDKLEHLARILGVIRSERGISVEEISYVTGLEYRTTAFLTGLLESDGIISIDLLKRCTINK